MSSLSDRPRNAFASAALRTQPDRRLVELARGGHDAAFEEVVRRHRAPLVAYAATIVPHDRAEDVVQSALMKAQRAIAQGGLELDVRPYLFTIVRNTALNDLRDQPVFEHLDEDYDGVPQPPVVAERREGVRALVTALMALPAAQREAIVKREFEGRGHDEIAAELGTTGTAVRGLIFRARSNLRSAVGLLVPAPALRLLLANQAAEVGAAGPLAESLFGAKVAGLAAVAALALGGGIALETVPGGDGPSGPGTAEASSGSTERSDGATADPAAAASGGAADQGTLGRGEDRRGSSGPGGGDSDGEGRGDGGNQQSDGNSGPGGADGKPEKDDGKNEKEDQGTGKGDSDDDDDNSGSGGGSSGKSEDDDEDDPDEDDSDDPDDDEDNSGSGSDSSGSGSGSGSSGSGSGSSGSGSGSSGSGSGSSGSSSSGSGSD